MAASMAHNKHGSNCPSDAAAQGTITDNYSQAAVMKNDGRPPAPKNSRKSPIPSKGAPKCITQEDDVPEEPLETASRTNIVPPVLTQVGTVSDEFSDTGTTTNTKVGVQAVPPVVTAMVVSTAKPKASTKQRGPPPTYTKAVASLSEEDLDYQKHQRSLEKNLGLALNGQAHANTEFVKALSLDVSTSFTQWKTKVYIISKNIQSDPMPNFRKKFSTESLTKKKKEKKKESLLSMFGPIPLQIDLMVNIFFYKTDNSVAGKLGVLSRNEITNQFKDYKMKKNGTISSLCYGMSMVVKERLGTQNHGCMVVMWSTT
eukprot:jgi/Psemu1/12816/gm1.12816_g